MFQACGWVGQCRGDRTGVLLFEVPVGCFHVLVSRQSVPGCLRRLCEVLVDKLVLMLVRKL